MDGDLDLVTNNLNEPSVLYENRANDLLGNHYIKVRLTGSRQNSFAVGSKVEVHSGGIRQVQNLYPARGYMSSSDPVLNFGIGQEESVDAVKVTWPDGNVTRIEKPGIDRILEVSYDPSGFTDMIDTEVNEGLFMRWDREAGITHRHREVPYNDFEAEPLLPHKLSQNGPFIAVGDANGDDLEDFFIGGSAGQEGVLFIQDEKGEFAPKNSQVWKEDREYEDQQPLLFDADGDGDNDLYVVSGSNEFREERMYQDRLYLNDGKGNFSRAVDALPAITASGQDVAATDFDLDGDLDLVVGGRVVPGRYPSPPRSYLLENEEGKFTDVTDERAPGLSNIGMVTALEFSDLDNDGDPDLVIAGEWMPLTVMKNTDGKFIPDTAVMKLASSTGWWLSLAKGDLDNDGDVDLVAGNIGLNNPFQPCPENPLQIYYSDFDNNGTGDIILSKIYEGIEYPVRSREYLLIQLPYIEKKYPDFESYGKASLEEILPEGSMDAALHYRAEQFAHCLLLNDGQGRFDLAPLPNQAQVSPLNGILLLDINADQQTDIVAAGNLFGTEPTTIRYDAGSGICLTGDGKGNFQSLSVQESGFYCPGDVKDLELIRLAGGSHGILVTNNNGDLQLFIRK
jgi:hypothetical protein